MFSKFFIDRPIFASVLSIIVTLAGAVSLWTLPVAQYPEIAPPTIVVTASYPGASAEVVSDTVSTPLGLKVVGELPMVGVAPAIANAVYHATGKRVRRLPIRIEDVI